MQFKKGSVIILSVAAALFLFLYFGFKQKGPIQSNEEKSANTSSAAEAPVFGEFQTRAMAALKGDSAKMVENLLSIVNNKSTQQAEKINNLKTLSGLWYRKNEFYLAGHFAAEVAKEIKTGEAWHIAGSSFMQGTYGDGTDAQKKQACAHEAIHCFETAMKLEPKNPDHEISLATVYTQEPPQDQPMKGILMLLDLNKRFPENVAVLSTLGRLAIKTGQYDKAVGRLEKARSLDPDNKDVKCLLSLAYKGVGKDKESADLAQFCK